MYPIFQFGSEELKRRLLPDMASGALVGCFGLTEANQGSDPSSMRTQATKCKGGWRLEGSKAWITNGSIADVAVVWAKDEDHVIRGFVVEKDTPGFTTRDTKHKLSLRASITSELFFSDCFVPEHNVLSGVQGLKGPLMCLNQARYGIAWGVVGAAISSFKCALNYSKERIQFGRPIASFQLTQKKLVDCLVEIGKAQLLNVHLGRMKDNGQLKPSQVSFAKMNNVSIALQCARICRSILGANGITGDFPIMRHLCNLESVYTYEGTHEMHTLILGQEITGLNAFR
jgi:glutaryl-CoA dehydrogenase